MTIDTVIVHYIPKKLMTMPIVILTVGDGSHPCPCRWLVRLMRSFA